MFGRKSTFSIPLWKVGHRLGNKLMPQIKVFPFPPNTHTHIDSKGESEWEMSFVWKIQATFWLLLLKLNQAKWVLIKNITELGKRSFPSSSPMSTHTVSFGPSPCCLFLFRWHRDVMHFIRTCPVAFALYLGVSQNAIKFPTTVQNTALIRQ